jgi:hypothetical protein
VRIDPSAAAAASPAPDREAVPDDRHPRCMAMMTFYS